MSLEENKHHPLLNLQNTFQFKTIQQPIHIPNKSIQSCTGIFMHECQSCYVHRFLAQLWRADVPHRKNKFQHTTVMNFERREWIRYSQLRCSASHSFLMLRDVSCYILQKSSLQGYLDVVLSTEKNMVQTRYGSCQLFATCVWSCCHFSAIMRCRLFLLQIQCRQQPGPCLRDTSCDIKVHQQSTTPIEVFNGFTLQSRKQIPVSIWKSGQNCHQILPAYSQKLSEALM